MKEKRNKKQIMKVLCGVLFSISVIIITDMVICNSSGNNITKDILASDTIQSEYFGYVGEQNAIVNKLSKELTEDGFSFSNVRVVEDKIYFISSAEYRTTWFNAYRFCLDHGCNLASITNEEEYAVLKMALQGYDLDYYLGTYTGTVGDDWTNTDGIESDYTTKHNITNNLENGAVLSFNGFRNEFYNNSYVNERPFIIEYNIK